MPRDAVSRTANVGTVGMNGYTSGGPFGLEVPTTGAFNRIACMISNLLISNINYINSSCKLTITAMNVSYIPLDQLY